MATATAARTPKHPSKKRARLRCRIRLADGRLFAGELPAERHRAVQIAMLHRLTHGLVELAAGTRRDGRLLIQTRRRADHFLPGGAAREEGWLDAVLELAARHADRGEEVFLAPAARVHARGDKHAVSETRVLWVGAHAYWKLDQPLQAARHDEGTGEVWEPIERANLRLVHALGVDADGKPNVADPACAERSRVMRLAGTVNAKTGQYARIIEADFALPPYPLERLVGDLPDRAAPVARKAGREGKSRDPYKRISPPEYFEKLAGIVVPRDGLVSCPAAWHEDRHPSCSVGTSPETGWCCHSGSCGARGAIYDLASVLLGGPWGRELRGEAFKRARAYVADVFGERQPQPAKEER